MRQVMKYNNKNWPLTIMPRKPYLYFKSLSTGAKLEITKSARPTYSSGPGPTNCKISFDDGDTWIDATSATYTLNNGETMLMKGEQEPGTYFDNGNYTPFVKTKSGTWEIGGDLSSLYGFSDQYHKQRFRGFFNGCRGTVYADKLVLHANVVNGVADQDSYGNMFRDNQGCIRTAPTIGEGTFKNTTFGSWMHQVASGSGENITFTTYATGISGGNAFADFNDGVQSNRTLVNNGTLPNGAYGFS